MRHRIYKIILSGFAATVMFFVVRSEYPTLTLDDYLECIFFSMVVFVAVYIINSYVYKIIKLIEVKEKSSRSK